MPGFSSLAFISPRLKSLSEILQNPRVLSWQITARSRLKEADFLVQNAVTANEFGEQIQFFLPYSSKVIGIVFVLAKLWTKFFRLWMFAFAKFNKSPHPHELRRAYKVTVESTPQALKIVLLSTCYRLLLLRPPSPQNPY